MNAPASRTHEDVLKSEERICRKCGYAIRNPMTDRCPRCFSRVERQVTNCGSCTAQGSCEFAHLVKDKDKTK